MICIYSITNKLNSKVYIGKTTCFTSRQKDHLRRLKNGKHINKHLQYSYNKYGKEVFIFNILEECDNTNINDREKYWISFYDSTNDSKGYNLMYGGEGGVGTKETIEKQTKYQEKNKKKVYGFTIKGDFFKIWNSIKECSRELKVSPCDIRRTISGKHYSCKGYILQNNNVFVKRLTFSEKIKLRTRNPDGTWVKNIPNDDKI